MGTNLSLHFLEDTLGWLAAILMAIVLRFTDWYILDPLLSLAISFFILSKAIPRFWSTLKIFLDAVPEGVNIQKIKTDLAELEHVASINQLNLWTMDGLEKDAIVHVCLKQVGHMDVCKEEIRLTELTREILRSWKPVNIMDMIITIIKNPYVNY